MSFLLKPNDKSINSSTTWEFGEAFLNSAFRALLCFENETSSSPKFKIIIIYTIINVEKGTLVFLKSQAILTWHEMVCHTSWALFRMFKLHLLQPSGIFGVVMETTTTGDTGFSFSSSSE